MRSKLEFLTIVSLKRKIKTKWFLLANIVMALIIIGLANIDSLIDFFGGDFDSKDKIYVIDNTNRSFNAFNGQINEVSTLLKEDGKYEVINYNKNIDEAKKLIEEDDSNLVLVFDNDVANVLKATLITDGYIDTVDYQLINNAVNNTKVSLAITDSKIDPVILAKIYSPIEMERVYLDEDKKNNDENAQMLFTMIFPIIILPFFMLTVFLVQMIGAEVNDEKSTRGMEIIISNVSPVTHFFSKVIAGNLFVLFQGLLLFLYGGLGLIVRKLTTTDSLMAKLNDKVNFDIKDMISSGLGDHILMIGLVTLVLMLLTFIAYSLLAGILASMTTNIEDFQQLQTPIMIVSLIGFYLAITANLFEGSIFIRIVSYIPLISAILSPSLLILGQIGIIDVMISILLMLITIYILIKYGLRIYKVGILNYSSSGLWKKMFKALKS